LTTAPLPGMPGAEAAGASDRGCSHPSEPIRQERTANPCGHRAGNFASSQGPPGAAAGPRRFRLPARLRPAAFAATCPAPL